MDVVEKRISLSKLGLGEKKLGFIAVLIGIVVSLVLGACAIWFDWTFSTWIYWPLVLGIIVGILNIFHEEGALFLLSGLTIIFMLYVLAGLPFSPSWSITLIYAVICLLAPANIIVGLKVLYALATK